MDVTTGSQPAESLCCNTYFYIHLYNFKTKSPAFMCCRAQYRKLGVTLLKQGALCKCKTVLKKELAWEVLILHWPAATGTAL